MTGKATVNAEGIKPAIRSIVNTFGEWWSNGERPMRDHDEFITWKPRKHNKTSDLLCNKSMNGEIVNWTAKDAEEIIASRTNVTIHGDGGYRKEENKRAIGWIIKIVMNVNKKNRIGKHRNYTLAMGNELIEGEQNIFDLETQAIGAAIDKF